MKKVLMDNEKEGVSRSLQINIFCSKLRQLLLSLLLFEFRGSHGGKYDSVFVWVMIPC